MKVYIDELRNKSILQQGRRCASASARGEARASSSTPLEMKSEHDGTTSCPLRLDVIMLVEGNLEMFENQIGTRNEKEVRSEMKM